FQIAEIPVPGVLDVMRQRLLNVTYIARIEVHCAGTGAGADYCHACFAADVVLPLVGILMPMQFAHTARVHGNDRDGDGGRFFERGGVYDAHLSTRELLQVAFASRAEREVTR